MKQLIENYINGNLSEALRLAKRFGQMAIIDGFAEIYNYTVAVAICRYLKGLGSFQAACDAEANFKAGVYQDER